MLYLLYGPDEFSRSEALAQLLAVLPSDLRDLNVARLEGRKLSLDTLMVACEAMPFLADRRITIVTDALKQTKAGKDRDALRTYLERVPATCDLIFVEREDVDRRSSLFTYLKKVGSIQEFLPRQGSDLVAWLGERSKLLNVRLDKSAAQRLIDYAGNDSRTLVTELTKVATYAGAGKRITAEMIDLLVQDEHEYNLFTFIDDLSLQRGGAALAGVRALLAEGQAAAYILFMLMRQVRILFSVRALVAERMRPDEIAAQLGQKPFVIRKALEQVRGFETGQLEALHDRLVAVDRAIKTGRIVAEVGLEILVVETCNPSYAD